MMMTIGIVLSIAFSYSAYRHDLHEIHARVSEASQVQTELIRNLSIDALIAEDRPALQTIIEGLKGVDIGLRSMLITNFDGETLASWSRETGMENSDHFEEIVTPIDLHGQNFGSLVLSWDRDEIMAPLRARARKMATILLGSVFVIGLCLVAFVELYFIRPLGYLEEKVDAFSGRTEETPGRHTFCSRELMRLDKSLDQALLAVEERKAKENELREEKAKVRVAEAEASARTEFLSLMSHEIRTPLGAILGFAELIDSPNLSKEQRDSVDHIRDSGAFLLHILNDILDLAKIEADGVQLGTEPFSVANVIRDVGLMLSDQAKQKGLTLNLDSNLPPGLRVSGDVYRLKQILMNLAGNAVKFTEAGEVRIAVEARGEDVTEGDTLLLRFTISDTGIGMTDDQTREIFKPFSQADATITRRFGGTGLGVSISRDLVDLMGGELTAQSVLGEGSEFGFCLELPVASSSELALPEPEDHSKQLLTTAEHTQLRILVAEDAPVNQRLIQSVMKRMGQEPCFANDGQHCLDILSSGQEYDALFLDLHMPKVDGMDVLKRIRSGECSAASAIMPIIMMSADVLSKDEAMDHGATDFIMKPISFEHLERVLSRPPECDVIKESLDPQILVADERKELATGKRIMIADDNAVVRELMGKLLSKWGYRADFAEDGVDCLEQLSLGQYDAIVSDLRMPNMDGKTLISRIREGGAGDDHRSISVALMTAEAIAEEDAIAILADSYIPKPIPLESLRLFLEEAGTPSLPLAS